MHWGDPLGLYKRSKDEQMMVYGLYHFLRLDTTKPKPAWSPIPPASVNATPDAWGRANHFRVA